MPRQRKGAALKAKETTVEDDLTAIKNAGKTGKKKVDKENQPSPKVQPRKSPGRKLAVENEPETKKAKGRPAAQKDASNNHAKKPTTPKSASKPALSDKPKGSPLQTKNTSETPKSTQKRRSSSRAVVEEEKTAPLLDENVETVETEKETSPPPEKKPRGGRKPAKKATTKSPKQKKPSKAGEKAVENENEQKNPPTASKPQGKQRGRQSLRKSLETSSETPAPEASEIPMEENDEAPTKPKRGRPSLGKGKSPGPKSKAETAQPEEHIQKEEKAPAPKKGRGKSKTPKTSQDTTAVEEETELKSDGTEKNATGSEEKTPKGKRGRKPKPSSTPKSEEPKVERDENNENGESKKKEQPKDNKAGGTLARRSEMYNKIRLEKIAERNKILSEMGLLQAKGDVQKIRADISQAETNRRLEERRQRSERRKAALLERRKNRPEGEDVEGEEEEASPPAFRGEVRRSGRVKKRVRHAYLPAVDYTAEGIDGDDGDEWAPTRWERDDDSDEEVDYSIQPGRINRNNYKYTKPYGPRPQSYGAIPGVPVGESFESREEANWAGIHRPTVAGISGSEIDGAYSICMNGGYEDDVDSGTWFTFTGAGGRDLKGTKAKPKNLRTAPQSKNQSLVGVNLSLAVSCELNKPVRVMRGYKLKSPYAPTHGYRYDGLYNVAKFYETTGLSGFQVFCFIFKRCEDQAPPPWVSEGKSENMEEEDAENNEDEEEEKEPEEEEEEEEEEENAGEED